MNSTARKLIPNGGSYAKVGKSDARNLRGFEVLSFTVTSRLEDISRNPCWELTCRLCGAKRSAYGSAIVGMVTAGTHQIRACQCVTGRILDTNRCREAFGFGAPQTETLLAVMAYERIHDGLAPLRLEVKKMLGRDPDSRALVSLRYLEQTGNPSRLRATARAWRDLGFSISERLTLEGGE